MAKIINSPVVVLILNLSMCLFLCEAIGKRKRPSSDVALFECLHKQVCDCNLPERYNECYLYLTQETRNWFIDRINECEIEALEYGSFTNVANLACPHERDELKSCYDVVNNLFMERVKLAATGQLGPNETAAFEAGRKCIEPNVSFCIAFQDRCMSVGK
ncbi:uncharacterized protein NPIL_391471 [Nephila pilipes]|nr:uncharacterized protein NPIL_389011 [Nephila pilipes]GFS68744.1 uncharacterized protein NPIL_391471 [Nephila pilipes]